MGEEKISISGVTGDVVIGSGTGNIVGKNVTISGTVTISNQQLAKVPSEYAKSLQDFVAGLNQLMEKHRVPPEQAGAVQEKVQELAKEAEGVRGDKIGMAKEDALRSKVSGLIDTVLKVLPKGVEAAASFTPLAPFSKLIGRGIEQMVKAMQSGG